MKLLLNKALEAKAFFVIFLSQLKPIVRKCLSKAKIRTRNAFNAENINVFNVACI